MERLVAVLNIRSSCIVLRASKNSGPRKAAKIKLVVVHSTEGGTAQSVAIMNHSTTAKASEHIVVDDNECYRMLPDLVVPWAAPGANESGLHMEHCGFKHWTAAQWLQHETMLRRSAYKTARWAFYYKIPLRWIGPIRIRLGWRGFTRHQDVTKAYPDLGDHTDPGIGFPRDKYMAWVKQYYAEIAT